MAEAKSYFGAENIKPDMKSYSTSAKNSLRQAESSASKTTSSENAEKSFYTGSGKSSTAKSLKTPLRFNLSNLKGRGALATIFTILLAIGGIAIFGANGFLPGALANNIPDQVDVQHTSTSLRTPYIMRQTLNGKRPLTPFMKRRLAKNGIEVGRIDVDGNFIKDDGMFGRNRVLRFNGETIDADQVITRYTTDDAFRNAMVRAKRGRVAGFFDGAATKFKRKYGLMFNVFEKFRSTDNPEENNKAYAETRSKKLNAGNDTDINTTSDTTETDDEGRTTTERTANGEDTNTKNTAGDTAEVKANNYISSVSQKAATGTNSVCAAMRAGNMISVAVSVAKISASVVMFTTMIEAISKMMAGESAESPINETLNFLTSSTTETITNATTGEEEEVTGSPLESAGMLLLLSNLTTGAASNANNYALGRSNETLLSKLTDKDAVNSCALAQGAAAVVSLASLLIPGGALVKMTIGMALSSAVIGGGIQLAIGAALSVLVPTVAKALFEDPSLLTGIPAGENIALGASKFHSMLARHASGLVPSSKNQMLAFNQAQARVIAADAKLDRLNKSPFDLSSKNTFLGSLAHKFLPIFQSHSKLTPTLTNFTNLTRQSIASLHSTYAASENSSYITTFNNCGELESIGAAGDIYCNDLDGSDLSTIDIEPDDPTYQAVIAANVTTDADGNETVKDGSDLANTIAFCYDRESPFGISDANIANAFQLSLGAVGDNIPVLEDVVDIVNAVSDAASQPWATGSICVNSEENPEWNTKMKYFQRWMEDNRIMEQMGAYESSTGLKNPVTAFRDKYYKEHPLDNSPAGLLSRFSGMTKADAETTLATMEYYQYLAHYHPENSYDFTHKKPKSTLSISTNLLKNVLSKLSLNTTPASRPIIAYTKSMEIAV